MTLYKLLTINYSWDDESSLLEDRACIVKQGIPAELTSMFKSYTITLKGGIYRSNGTLSAATELSLRYKLGGHDHPTLSHVTFDEDERPIYAKKAILTTSTQKRELIDCHFEEGNMRKPRIVTASQETIFRYTKDGNFLSKTVFKGLNYDQNSLSIRSFLPEAENRRHDSRVTTV